MENTATQAISFKDRISALNEDELRALASEEFNVTIDGQLKKDIIIKYLLDVYEETRKEAQTMNKESAQLFLDRDEKEPIIQVKFIPLEFPNAPYKFHYDGGFGVEGKGGTKLKPGQEKRLKRIATFKLMPSETYKLPLVVVRWLESLTYRDSKPIIDPVSGLPAGNQPVIKPRFMLQPILTDQQLSDMSTSL